MHVVPEVVFALVLGATTGAGVTLWVWIHAYLNTLQHHLDSFPSEYRRQRMLALEGVAAIRDVNWSLRMHSTAAALRRWRSRAVPVVEISDERTTFRRTAVQLRAALTVWRFLDGWRRAGGKNDLSSRFSDSDSSDSGDASSE